MSSPVLKRKLLVILSDHGRLLRQILRHQRILRGSYHQVYTRCGKSNCWCAKARKGHPHRRLTWSEEGRMTTRKVAPTEQKTIIKLIDHYRQFCDQRQQLSALASQLQNQLDQYEKALINQTRKALRLLVPTPSQMSVKTQLSLQTRRRKKT